MRLLRTVIRTGVVVALCLPALPLPAADRTYTDGAGDNLWSSGGNWDPAGAPVAGDTAIFNDAGADAGTAVTSLLDITGLNLTGLEFYNGTGNNQHLDLNGNTLKVDDHLYVGRLTFGQTNQVRLSNGSLELGSPGFPVVNVQVGYRNATGGFVDATLTAPLSGLKAYAVNFDIGRVFGENQDGVAGRLDLSAGGETLIEAGRLYLGTMTGNGIPAPGAKGTILLPLAATSTLYVTDIWVGDSPLAGNTAVTSLLQLGRTTVIQADNFDVARRKALANVQFGPGVTGGVVSLAGRSGAAADMKIGWNDAATGAGSRGIFDTRGGILNATLDEVVLGLHASGTGNGQGSLFMDNGTVTINTLRMAQTDTGGSSSNDGSTTGTFGMNGGDVAVAGNVVDGNGVSTVFVDSGIMNVAGAFNVDDLRIGFNGGTGSLAVAGPVRIGNGTAVMEIGFRSANQNVLSEGTADFTNAPSVTIDASILRLGNTTAGSSINSTGWMLFPAAGSNAVSLTSLHVGDSSAAGNTADTSEFNLGGGSTVLNIDEINVGQRKSRGLMRAEAGAVVTLGGRSKAGADLFVGRNNVDTGTNCEGLFALTNGTLNAMLGQVTLGLHNTGSGSGKGTFIMGPGTVIAADVGLADASAAGTSSNPLNTQGRLLIRDGSFTVTGSLQDRGGTSLVEVTRGTLDVGHDFVADTVSLGQAGGSNATLVLNGRTLGQSWQIGEYAQEATGTLEINLSGNDPIIGVTNASFASGSTLRLGVTGGGAAFTNLADATAWTGGVGVWDDVSDSPWSNGNPAEHVVIASNDVIALLTASGNLTDNGLVLDGTNWILSVFPGAAGSIVVERDGADITTGQRPALISDPAAVVSRATDLLIGDATGSGAAASSLTMTDGSLSVDGGLLDDGGYGAVRVDGGALAVNGGLDADSARFGYLGHTALATLSNGPVRIGNLAAPEVVDMGRREGTQGGLGTTAVVSFAEADSVSITASSLRIGTAAADNGPIFLASLTLSSAGSNTLVADSLTLGDSPQEGNGDRNNNGPTNVLHFGALNNVLTADAVYIGRRKIVARADIAAGGILTLNGKSTSAVLRVGFNDSGTGTVTEGMLDLSGGIFHASLASLQVGRHDNGAGAGKGAFIMDDGSVTVSNDVELARVSVGGTSSNPLNTTGTMAVHGGTLVIGGDLVDGGGVSSATLNGADVTVRDIRNLDTLALTGGSLTARAITNATGVTAFTFSNARLSASVIGIGTNVVQNGGVLAPGASAGTTAVSGGYEVTGAGTWEFELDGYAHDRLDVSGTLTLGGGAVLDLSEINPVLAEAYILATYGNLAGTFASTNAPAGWTVDYNYQGGGAIALVQIPGIITNFTVEVSNGLAVVRWNTTNETSVAGFHVERADELGQWQRLTGAMIPANGFPSSYAFTDTTAVLGRLYSYRVIIVDTGAGETPAGPYVRSAVQDLVLGESVAAGSGVVNVTWKSNEGKIYRVERTPALVAPEWTALATNLPATPPQNTYSDTNAPSPDAYYRVLVEP